MLRADSLWLPALSLGACLWSGSCSLGPDPATTDPSLEVGGHRFHYRTLANGLQAFSVWDPEDDGTASIFLVIGSGTRDESEETTGLAHLTEHALYTGTKRTGPGEHDRIVQEDLGAESNAFTRDDYTLYYDHGIPAGSLQQVLDLEADRMANLSFAVPAFLHERGRLRAEEAHTYTPSAGRTEQLESAVYRQEGYRYGLRDAEGLTMAPELEIELVQRFYQQHYRPDNAAVIVVSPLPPSKVLDLVEDSFAAWRSPERPHPRELRRHEPEPFGMRNARFESGLSRDRIEFACTVPGWHDDDFPALAVAARVFARRYADQEHPFQVTFSARNGSSLFSVAATGEQAYGQLEEVYADLLENGPAPQELTDAIREEADAYTHLPLRARPYFSLAVEVARFAAHDRVSFLLDYQGAVEAVDSAKVTAVLRRWLDPGRRVVVHFPAAQGVEVPEDWPAATRDLAKLAQEAADSGEYDYAVAAYGELLARKPNKMNTVIYLATRGQLHMDHEQLDRAIADFERALVVVDYPAVRDLLDEARRRRDG